MNDVAAEVGQPAFTPFDPNSAVVPAHGADRAVRSLLDNRICQVQSALAPDARQQIRARAETAMAGTDGGLLLTVLGERVKDGEELYRVDPAIFLGLLSSPCLAIVRAYFKERVGVEDAIMIPMNMIVRKYQSQYAHNDDIKIPFHQDAFGFPPEFLAVNCWCLMSPDECGDTSPGLEFVPDRLNRMIPLEKNPTTKHYSFLETSHAEIGRYLSHYTPWRPSIRLGDVTMFDGFALHRTYLNPAQTGQRHSAEIRLIAKTPAVEDYMAQHRQDVFTVREHAMFGPSVIKVADGKIAAEAWGRWEY